MRVLTLLLCAAVLVPISSIAFAGPFGLDLKTQEVPDTCSHFDDDIYKCSPPMPHPDLNEYGMSFLNDLGICFVFGAKTLRVNSFGTQALNLHAELVQQLTQKYGEGEDRSQLLPGSIWNEPKDFLMSLREGDRQVLHVIRLKSNPDNIQDIAAVIRHSHGNNLDVVVAFYTTNSDSCIEMKDRRKRDAF